MSQHWMQFDHKADNQEQTILKHLIKYGPITSIQAIRLYGITRLAEIIRRIKEAGHVIETELQYDQQNKSRHWAVYSLNIEPNKKQSK